MNNDAELSPKDVNVTEKYITGSQAEFRHWLPEVHENIFSHFNVASVYVYVYDPAGNKVAFIYRPEAPPLSPDYAGRIALHDREEK